MIKPFCHDGSGLPPKNMAVDALQCIYVTKCDCVTKMIVVWSYINKVDLNGLLVHFFYYLQLSKPSCSSDARAVMIMNVSSPPRRPISPTAGHSARQVATAMPAMV